MDAVFVARNTVFAATAGAKTVLNVIAGANQLVLSSSGEFPLMV
jgi:hypothetical protein